MSGGVSNTTTVENIFVWETRGGVRIKTAPGRGGYVRNINMTLENVRIGIVVKTDCNEHPDKGFESLILKDVNFQVRVYGSEDIPIKDVSFREVSVGLTYKKKHIFQCSFVDGRVLGSIFPFNLLEP